MTMYRTDAAVFFPTACICGGITGPFADTGVELFDRGAYHVYICDRCGNELCDLFGHTRREERETLNEQAEAHLARIAELEAKLEQERANKVVSVADVRELLAPKRATKSAA